jgi:hypothetical protein
VTLTDASRRRGDRFADDPDPALLAVGVDEVLSAVDEVTASDAAGGKIAGGHPGWPRT